MAREAHWAEYIALIRRRNDMGETLRRAWDDESRAVYGESLRKAQAALDAFEASCEPETKPTPAWDAGWDGWGR
ncbi:hypothetical protein BN12_1680002 [Nostocoides japonicum T1-X7]|uniref:Uncharacterized protein n=2 Tax=Nostocoides japonicum TaxID=99481 RepID=A0A077LUE8_9MICO|nr:hypothetical protein BN12_1680002 [Tetrasphaera japonica T1-X7]